MTSVFDLKDLYQEYFGKKLMEVSGLQKNESPRSSIHYSKKQIAFNKTGLYGQDIWHPVTFKTRYKDEEVLLEIEACTIAINLVKTIVKTPVSERRGTVKEIFNVDDYKFTIRGFVIGKNRKFPEEKIESLKKIFETGTAVEMHGGYPEMFLDKSCRVVVSSLEFPEVQEKCTG